MNLINKNRLISLVLALICQSSLAAQTYDKPRFVSDKYHSAYCPGNTTMFESAGNLVYFTYSLMANTVKLCATVLVKITLFAMSGLFRLMQSCAYAILSTVAITLILAAFLWILVRNYISPSIQGVINSVPKIVPYLLREIEKQAQRGQSYEPDRAQEVGLELLFCTS
jgi:hypothetical protein